MRHSLKLYCSILILFSLFYSISCTKEDLEYTGQKTDIDFKSIDTNGSATVPNCQPLNPADYPATGEVNGKIIVNGRAFMPDGKVASNTQVWLFSKLNIIGQKMTDANGRFSFETKSDTAQSTYYYVAFDPMGAKKVFSIQNCRYSVVLLEKNRIQNLEIKSCYSAEARIKTVNTTKSDSVSLQIQYASSCDTIYGKSSVSFGSTNQMLTPEEMVKSFNTNFSKGYNIRFAKGSNILLVIERKRNGVKTSERKAINTTKDDEEIVVEL
jgi:hypothetical protein